MREPGAVSKVRELRRGVQAEVCLGGSTTEGWAMVKIESCDDEVMAALANLKQVMARKARVLMAAQLEGQREWDAQRKS